MKNRNYNYIKATDIIMKITTGLLICEIAIIIHWFFLCLIFDVFDPYDYSFSASISCLKILLFFVIFLIVYIIFESKDDRNMTLSDKRKIYLFYSIIKLVQSSILFFRILTLYIDYKDLLYLIILVFHACIFTLSIISLVLCLIF
ncbi:MAG: hypothetical protein K2N85_05470, partial [Lachnospiraceae bacterium]|nr:hypothetical protein [Lachnospiraceae bacterium]